MTAFRLVFISSFHFYRSYFTFYSYFLLQFLQFSIPFSPYRVSFISSLFIYVYPSCNLYAIISTYNIGLPVYHVPIDLFIDLCLFSVLSVCPSIYLSVYRRSICLFFYSPFYVPSYLSIFRLNFLPLYVPYLCHSFFFVYFLSIMYTYFIILWGVITTRVSHIFCSCAAFTKCEQSFVGYWGLSLFNKALKTAQGLNIMGQ